MKDTQCYPLASTCMCREWGNDRQNGDTEREHLNELVQVYAESTKGGWIYTLDSFAQL